MAEQKDAQGLPKRRRRGTPKARSGCLTCKIRHVKCDEQRPACAKCTTTGRTCDFLQPFPNGSKATKTSPRGQKLSERHSRQSTLSPNSPEDGLPLRSQQLLLLPKPSSPPSSLQLSSDEASHFDYFRVVCANGLSGYFENPLWESLVLQVSHAEPSIRHAAIALGALHRFEASRPLTDKDTNSTGNQYALIQYVQAVKTLNSRLNESPVSANLAIIASLLFMAFEVFQGNDGGALTHFEGAFAVLRDIHERHMGMRAQKHYTLLEGMTPPTSSPILQSTRLSDDLVDLTTIFTRLDIQASTFAEPYTVKPDTLCPPITKFTNITDARNTLDIIIANMHHLVRPYTDPLEDPTDDSPLPTIPPTDHLNDLFNEWHEAFKTFLSCQVHVPHPSAAVLQIQHLTAQIHLNTFATNYQGIFDLFLESFTNIVDLAESIIPTTLTTGIVSRQLFSFDVGIIQPLYFIGLRCRDGLIRRRILKILNNAGREGVWDGRAMAKVVDWVMGLEEEGSSGDIGMKSVTEAKRVHGVGLMFNRVKRIVKIRGMFRNIDPNIQGQWRYIYGEATWSR